MGNILIRFKALSKQVYLYCWSSRLKIRHKRDGIGRAGFLVKSRETQSQRHKAPQLLAYPKLSDMLTYILEQHPAILNSTGVGDTKLLFQSKTYVVMVKFLLKCFEMETAQPNVTGFLHSVERLCLLLEHAIMTYEGSVELHASASKPLINLASHFPQMIATRYAQKVTWLKQYPSHLDYDTRESMARLLGTTSSTLPISASIELINEVISSIGGTQKLRFEAHHGLLCALGYVIANCLVIAPPASCSVS